MSAYRNASVSLGVNKQVSKTVSDIIDQAADGRRQRSRTTYAIMRLTMHRPNRTTRSTNTDVSLIPLADSKTDPGMVRGGRPVDEVVVSLRVGAPQ